MGFNDFWINNNGKKEHLNNAKHGVRKEQVDKKFHNLFDAYDANGDGTLETEEFEGVFVGLNRFAGSDKTLDAVENQGIASLLANKANIKDADFMGFVRSVSQASQDIVSSETTPTPDGGKEVTTNYKDGTVETISYYPDGEYKFKKLDQKGQNQSYYLIGNNTEKQFSAHEIENQLKTNYEKYLSNFKPGENKKPISFAEFKSQSMKRFDIRKINSDFERHNLDLSERAKKDIEVRDFVLSHYIDTHKAAQEALESMGILDDVGAAINAGAGEVWNSIKNAWKGTEEEYQNFYELSKKFEPNYGKSLLMKGTQEVAQKHPENYFRGEVGTIDTDNGAKFQQVTEQYQNAQILQQRLDILNKAMREISMYQSEQDALTYAPAQSEGMNPASHILNANNLLLEYFNGDKEAVNMILNGAIGNSEATIKAINGLKEDTEKLNKSVLDGKTFDQVQDDYKSQYKTMYGTDFVPDEMTEKVMDAKATGGMVKLAAITAISVLITKSPIMTQMMGAAAGSAEATGAAANMIRTLTARYGATAVQQGIKFAMTSGTLATDVGLTLLNQATSERGVDGQELWESTKGSAKYIYFGSYIGAPLAQAVSKQLGKIGATAIMFEGGVKTATGGIQTTTIRGDKLVQNLMKGGNKVLTTGGAFLTDVAAFTGLEVATEGIDPLTAGKEQTEMLGKLKIMNHFIEYMLGGKVHAGMSKAKMDAAIENSGIKNWQIKEIKTPTKSTYEVQLEEGLPPIRFKDANELATAMMERVAGNYKGSVPTETPREPQTQVRTTPKVEVETKQKTTAEVRTPDVKPDGTEQNPLLTRLETANDRESFVAIRDEIKKMPNGEQKTQMMQAYLKKYNEWSADPARPDIRMEYKPEEQTSIDIKKLKIEKASDEDLKEIQKIDLEAFEGKYTIESDFDAYKADLVDQEITTYAIKGEDGKVVGYYQLEPVENGELYIHSIGVRSDLRNTKASYAALKQMQDNITKFSQENNIEKVALDVDADNSALVKLYKKFGFEVTDETSGVEAGHQYHDYHMEADVKKVLAKSKAKDEVSDVAETKAIELTETKGEIKPQERAEDAEVKQDEIENTKVIDDSTPATEKSLNAIRTVLKEDESISDEHLERLITSIPNEHCADVLAKYIEKLKAAENEDIHYLRYLKTPERIKEFVELLEDKDMPEITPVVARIMPLVDDKAELKTIIESGYLSGERHFDFGEFNATLEIEDPEWQANLIKLYGSRLFSNVRWYELYQNAKHMDLSNLDRIDKMMDRLNWHDEYSFEGAKNLLRLPNEQLDVIEKRGLLRNIEGREEKLCPSDAIELSEVDDKTWEVIKQRGLLKDIEDENSNGKYTHGLKSEQIIGLAELTDEEYANVQKRQLLTLKDIRSYYGDDFIGGSDLHTLAAMDDATFNEFKNLYDMTYTKIENKRVGGQYQDVETKERRFRVHECVEIVTASDEIKQRITKNDLLNQVRNGEPLSGDEIMQIASQNGNKQVLVDKFLAMKNSKGEDRFSLYEANTLAELSEEKLKIAEERHLFDEYPVTRSYGTETESFRAYNIEALINVPDKIWNQMEKSNLKTGISSYDYVKLSEMTEAQWKRAFECGMLPATNPPRIDIDEMINVTSLDDKCWQRYTEDLLPVRENIQIGADDYSWSKKNFQEITSFDDVAYSRYKDIMTIQRDNYRLHRFSLGDFKNISQVTDEQWSRIKDDLYKIDNLDKQLSSQEIKTLAELDDKAYGRVAEIIKKFQTVSDKFDLQNKIDKLIEVAQCDDAAYERVKPLLGSELISADVEKLAQMVKLTPNQHERLNNDLAGLNISKESKMVIAALPQDRYEEAIKLATSPLRGGFGQSLDGEVISKLLDLPPEKYNKVKDLIVLESSNGYQIQLGKYSFESDIEVLLNDEMMQRFKKDLLPIAKNNEKPILPTSVGNLKDILELSDAEYEQALENIKYVNSVPTRINEYQIKDFALLDKETFAKVKRDLISIDSLGEHQLDGYDIEKIAKLEPENYERCLTEIIPIADKYLKLESYYSDENPILTMSKLSNEDYQKIKEFLPELPQLTSKQIKEFVKLSESELENFVNRDIPGSTLSFDECIKLAQLSEDQYIKLIERANPETPLSYRNMEKISEMSDEQYPIVKNALEFFNKNIKLLKHQDMDVTPQLLSNMIVDNSNGLQNVIDIVGDSGLRHAVGLKYKGLKQLLKNATSLSNLDEGTKITLRDKLNELPHPEQKLAKLEIISALANNLDKTAITKILDEIKAPQMTKEQKELADRIFVSDKSYTEQIEDFIREFNVPDERQDLIRKFLLEQNLSEKYVTPPSIDEQIAIMDKKIQSIQRNDKIPANKKQAYLNQLERQKAEILANPEQYTQARINDRAMKPLEAQVEAHINLPNQNNAFTKALNKEIYNILKIDPTEELLTDVTYDSKYVSRMFAGMSDSNFRMNFNKLINMIKENPNRKFTDIIQEIPENIETRKLFEENGLDFDKWIKFNENSYEPFVVTVDVDKSVRSAKQNLKNELNSDLVRRLDQNQIAKINQILVENGFETAGQKDLPKIIKLIEKELDTGEYWKQNTPEIKTFKDHIQIHKKNIHDVEQLKDATEELHVRLWDKDDVGRNIFFGNHVGCCTSVGSFNSFAAPQHLMNAFVNGIEIVDKAGNSMGNSMCYFAKVDGKLTFVIDSFEANGKLGAAPEVTNAIIEYAKKVCAEMGQPDANIMFGPNYNKIDFSRCIKTKGHTIEIIGRVPENTYIDCIGGRGNINYVASERPMHEIMDL